jgi:hypothetical protein
MKAEKNIKWCEILGITIRIIIFGELFFFAICTMIALQTKSEVFRYAQF